MSSRALAELPCDRVEGRVGQFSAVPSLSAGMTARCARGSSPRIGTRFEHRCFRSALAGLRAVLHSEREPVGHQGSQWGNQGIIGDANRFRSSVKLQLVLHSSSNMMGKWPMSAGNHRKNRTLHNETVSP